MNAPSPQGPYLHSGASSAGFSGWTLLAVLPACVAVLWRSGGAEAALIIATGLAAWLTDVLFKMRIEVHPATWVTGLSLAMMMPRESPWWLGAIGGITAMAVAKHAFGGHRRNLMNPSAFARVALMLVLPTFFLAPEWTLDGVTGATVLAKESGATQRALTELLSGSGFGALAQASPIAVLIGGLLLMAVRVADWRVPLVYIGTIAVCVLAFPSGGRQTGHTPWLSHDLAAHVLAGGTLFTAFFLLTDPVTSPSTRLGRVLFAVVAGASTMWIRFYTPYPDGAAISVLLANLATPYLDGISTRRKAKLHAAHP